MAKIEHTIANQSGCLCPVCPVQAGSGCVDRKKQDSWIEMRRDVIGGILEEYAGHPETYVMPVDELKTNPVGEKHEANKIKREDMIDLYCSIGKSDCHDLDADNPCVCPDCVVWEGHELQARYFCQLGSAEAVER